MTEVVLGRGAWTKTGMPNSAYTMYKRNPAGSPMTGGEKARDADYEAVHYGVLAIQKLLVLNGSPLDYSSGPGLFGSRTQYAARVYQTLHVPPGDGVVGPNTMKSLLKAPVKANQIKYGIPDNLLFGVVLSESGADPGAVGYYSPADKGLVQINTNVHAVPLEQVFDPAFALDWAAAKLRNAYNTFITTTGGNERLAWDCAVANHNRPTSARQWAATGVPPNTTIAKYVEGVRRRALLVPV